MLGEGNAGEKKTLRSDLDKVVLTHLQKKLALAGASRSGESINVENL